MMKKHLIQKLLPALAIMAIATMSCSKQEGNGASSAAQSKTEASAEQKITQTSLFSHIPPECSVIGSIDVAAISQIKEIKDEIEANKSLPYYKELNEAGLEIANIDKIIFGIEPELDPKKADKIKAVVLVSTKNGVSLQKLIELIQKNNKAKLETVKVQGFDGFSLSDNSTPNKIIIFQMQKNILGIISESASGKLLLGNVSGKSIMDNADLMKLTGNAGVKSMFWIACVIPQEAYKDVGADAPRVTSGFISIDYISQVLNAKASINCLDKDNVQKLAQPIQMVSALVAMNPNYGIKPEDITLKPDNNKLDISIRITKDSFDKITKAMQESQQAQMAQPQELQQGDSQVNLEAEGLSFADTEAANAQNEGEGSTIQK